MRVRAHAGQRPTTRGVAVTLLVAMMLTAASLSAVAQPSDGGICIDPDIEFPVPCDEDDD